MDAKEELRVSAESRVEIDAAGWSKSLKPGGKLVLSVNNEALITEAKLPLLIQGFIINQTSKTQLYATKPEWEKGAKASLKRDDMVDEDELLAADGLETPEVPSDVGCSARKPCANCTCGRADSNPSTTAPSEPKSMSSSCGNCHKGDAFRCAGCPYLGKPAFKPGQEQLVLELTDDI
mmetsp:Transcript_6001/g.8492  ORF Transcript_6001/g.8492 Transcript_6001/m.8492 type:complete len:178 (+) Transcript_6001:45-578(+)